jgi:hypothetical protein
MMKEWSAILNSLEESFRDDNLRVKEKARFSVCDRIFH